MSKKLAPIIIKRKRGKQGHGHHGGAWKIAYADFVTAMMAFFLMMWLLNAVSDDQKKGIADYFAPNVVTMDFRQSGQAVLGGDNAQGKKSTRHDIKEDAPPAMQDKGEAGFSHKGGKSTDPKDKENDPTQSTEGETVDVVVGNKLNLRVVQKTAGQEDQKVTIQETNTTIRPTTREEKEQQDTAKLEAMEGPGGGLSEQQKSEQETLRQIEAEVEAAIAAHESWRPHIRMEITREGLVLNIMDLDKKPLFTNGSAALCKYTQDILKEISRIILPINNKIIVSGHTDAYNYTNEKLYSNWELSCDRANSARRYMVNQNIPRERFKRVDGLEAREPINADDIYAPENRRVRITIARNNELSFDQLKEISGQGKANSNATTSQDVSKQQAPKAAAPVVELPVEKPSEPVKPSVTAPPIIVQPNESTAKKPVSSEKKINISEAIPENAVEAHAKPTS